MKKILGLGAVTLLLVNVASLAAPPANPSTGARAVAGSAHADSMARAGVKAAGRDFSIQRVNLDSTGKPLPARHPKKSGKKVPRIRTASRDTLASAQLKQLDLPPAPPPPKGRPPRVTAVAFEVRHMVFGNFREVAIVGMQDEFRVGDSDFTGRIIQFVPDWAMGLETFKVYSRTNEPKNPAFRIVVREKGQVRDTVWSFLHKPPHFARNSMLSFKVARIEFADHAPVPYTAPDTSKTRAARKPDSTAARGGKP